VVLSILRFALTYKGFQYVWYGYIFALSQLPYCHVYEKRQSNGQLTTWLALHRDMANNTSKQVMMGHGNKGNIAGIQNQAM
jgi:hypothetical protein